MSGHRPWRELRAEHITTPEQEAAVAAQRRTLETVEYDELTPRQQAEVAAKRAHRACELEWEHLDAVRRSGTTFHGWEAHLPRWAL